MKPFLIALRRAFLYTLAIALYFTLLGTIYSHFGRLGLVVNTFIALFTILLIGFYAYEKP